MTLFYFKIGKRNEQNNVIQKQFSIYSFVQ